MNIDNAVKELQAIVGTSVGLPPLMAAYATQYMLENSRAIRDLSKPSWGDVISAPRHALVAGSPTRVREFGDEGAPLIYISTHPGIYLEANRLTKDKIMELLVGIPTAIDRMYQNLVAQVLGIPGSNRDHLPLTAETYDKCHGYIAVSDIIAQPSPGLSDRPRSEFKDGLFCFHMHATVSMAVLRKE